MGKNLCETWVTDMAREISHVHVSFWSDKKLRRVSLSARYLALFYLTGTHGNAAGVFYAPLDIVAISVGMQFPDCEAADKELQDAGFLRRCEETDYVWIRKYLFRNTPQNPNWWKAVIAIFDGVPTEISYAAEMLQVLEPFRNRLPTVWQRFGNYNTDTDTITDTDTDTGMTGKQLLLDGSLRQSSSSL